MNKEYENGFGSTEKQVKDGVAAAGEGRIPEFDGCGNENMDMQVVFDAWHDDWLLDN